MKSSELLNFGTNLENVKFFSPSTKSRFCEKDANLETFQKGCPHIAISYNSILKPAESLKQII